MNIQEVVDGYKSMALSDQDVMNLVDGKARVLLYKELKDYDTLDAALGEHGAIFLLYETSPSYGHWTLVMRRGRDQIEFFDSYGEFCDDELKWVSKAKQEELGQNYPYLSRLLYESKYPDLQYNNYRFQHKGAEINSCGRWCALRLVCRDLSLEEFKKAFHGKNSDDIVTILTSF